MRLRNSSSKNKTLKITKAGSVVPLVALLGLGAIGTCAVNQDVDPSASASNTTTLTDTISYDDEYITISNSSTVNLGTQSVTASDAYAYATDNVTVSTNVSSGYELYLSSASDTSSALTTPSSYTAIAATSGTGGDSGTPKVLDRNTYGYAVASSLINNTNFDSSYASPSASSKFAGVPAGSSDRIRSGSANGSGETTDVHYGVNVTNALAPGTYTGQVIYSAVVTPTSGTYTMSVSPSSGASLSTITVTSGPTTIATDASLDPSEVQIELRQSGKTKGDCKVTNVDVSSGHLVTTCLAYAPTGTYDVVVLVPRFGFKDTKTSGFTITSAPTLKGLINYHGLTTMQSLTTSLCSEAATWTGTSEDVILKDSRDNNEYYVRKLKDGHCWMVQNLRLTPSSLTNNGHTATLYASDNDTDLASGSFALPASAGWTSTSTTVNALVAAIDAPIGSTSGSKADSDLAYARGTYYSWPTAVLNTSSIGTSSAQTNSICPKNWDLPTYSGKQSFQNLYTSYSSNYTNTMTAYDYYYSTSKGVNYYLAGLWYTNGYVSNSGTNGYWWSSTSYSSDTNGAWLMNANTSSIYPQGGSNRYSGLTVRCVLAGS